MCANLQESAGRPFGNVFSRPIPFRVLARAKIRLGEDFLKTQYLEAFFAGLLDQWDMRIGHRLANIVGRIIG